MPANYNHPKKGSSIKVEPIRKLDDIHKIKSLLKDKPRDYCLFCTGINTAFRAGEILSLKIHQVENLDVGDRLEIKQSKTKTFRAVTVNATVVDSIQRWLAVHPRTEPNAPLFISQKGHNALTVSTVNRMIKRWCKDTGIQGQFGTHSMRKSWGYFQRTINNAPVALLMSAYGHASEAQTLAYLGIQDSEISDLYDLEL